MFLSWIIGYDKASYIINFEKKIEEKEIISTPDDGSNFIIEEVVVNDLDSFHLLFTLEAWCAVLQLGILFVIV